MLCVPLKLPKANLLPEQRIPKTNTKDECFYRYFSRNPANYWFVKFNVFYISIKNKIHYRINENILERGVNNAIHQAREKGFTR
jgi:hypothetical protein